MKLGINVSIGLIVAVFLCGMALAADKDDSAGDREHDMNCSDQERANSQTKLDPIARAKQHLTELKTKLNLTKEQEPALQTFSDQVNEQVKTTVSMQEKMEGVMPKTAPERVAMMANVTKIKAQNMAAMADKVKTFYSTLNPNQQATFDEMHAGHMGAMNP